MRRIGDYIDINVYSGQIMSRVVAGNETNADTSKEFRVIVPKAINSDGTILASELSVEILKVIPDTNRITELGDIVIKLSTPYDSAIISEEFVGCVVPSFCAIIRNKSEIETEYLQAFLSSKLCKDQLRAKVIGAVMTILSVGKIKDIEMPVPEKGKREEIGAKYLSVQKKITTLKQIVELEAKRNDLVFYNMVER